MTRALLIIQADHVASARALATAAPFSLTEQEAENLFVPAGSPTGLAPATHFWSSGSFTTEFWQAIQQLSQLLPWAECHAYDLDAQPHFPDEQLDSLGLQRMKGDMV